MISQKEEFMMALNGERGALDAWLEVNNEAECRLLFKELLAPPAAPQVVADERALPPITGFGRYTDSMERGLLVTFERRLTDNELVCARAALQAAPVQAQETFGFVNVKLGTFMPAAAFAHTERNTELLASGEVIKVCRAKMAPRIITKENAAQYLEELMWDFIDTSGNFPSILIDPRTWAHALCYAPVQPVAVPGGSLPELPPLPKTDIEGGYYDSESGFTKKAIQEYAIAYGQACHAMGRGAAVREYVENGTFAAPAAQGDKK